LNVIWAPEAIEDRWAIASHIGSDNPRAAVKMDELFEAAAARLGRRPHIGRPGRIEGTRELIPHENYRMVYEIDGNAVHILALVHVSRQWPPVRS
jgi:toxin ParE1/3/4